MSETGQFAPHRHNITKGAVTPIRSFAAWRGGGSNSPKGDGVSRSKAPETQPITRLLSRKISGRLGFCGEEMALCIVIFMVLLLGALFEELHRHRGDNQAALIHGIFWGLWWIWVLAGLVGLCVWSLFFFSAFYILFGRDGMTAWSVVAAFGWIIIWSSMVWLGTSLRNSLLRFRSVSSAKTKRESEKPQIA